MSKDKILKISIPYWMLKQHAKFCHWLYYKKIYVRGLENIPAQGPIIFAPNHQNALMDPMAVLFTQFRYMIYLARADIFSKPVVARILYFLKILPIYRIRDGYSSLQNNDAIFKRTVNALKNGMPLLMLPEGNHEGFRRLRSFKKGLARIAFMAEEQAQFGMGIQIVPVGIDYSHYVKCRQNLFVQYGKPIPLADYKELYAENQPRAIQKLTDDLYSAIQQLIIHVPDTEHYETYRSMRDIYLRRFMTNNGITSNHYVKQFEAEQTMVALMFGESEKDEKFITKLTELTEKHNRVLNSAKLRSYLFEKSNDHVAVLIFRLIILICVFPLFITGLIFNYLPFMIPVWISKKVKDVQFQSSFKYVLGLIVFPIFYLLYLLFPGLLFSGILWKLLCLPLLLLNGMFALWWYIQIKKIMAKFRFNKFRKSVLYNDLNKTREEIFDLADSRLVMK